MQPTPSAPEADATIPPQTVATRSVALRLPTNLHTPFRVLTTLTVLTLWAVTANHFIADLFGGHISASNLIVAAILGFLGAFAINALNRFYDRLFAPPPADPNALPAIRLKPAGHNAFAEGLANLLIPVGSTTLVSIAGYVLAQDQLVAIWAGTASGIDYFVVGLVIVLGFMVDTALIVASARFKMHIMRGGREWGWAVVTGLMVIICLSVEAMTLMYFGYLVAPHALPPVLVGVITNIHDTLFFIRNALPPFIVAFFATCLMPLTVEASDLDRAMKAESSMNMLAIQQYLIRPGKLKTPEQMIDALESQMHLNEHASHATAAEIDRNKAYLEQLRSTYGLKPGQLTKPQEHLLVTQVANATDQMAKLANAFTAVQDDLDARLATHTAPLVEQNTALMRLVGDMQRGYAAMESKLNDALDALANMVPTTDDETALANFVRGAPRAAGAHMAPGGETKAKTPKGKAASRAKPAPAVVEDEADASDVVENVPAVIQMGRASHVTVGVEAED